MKRKNSATSSLSNIAEKENTTNLTYLNTHMTIPKNPTNPNLKKKKSSAQVFQINNNNELFFYDFEKGFHWSHYYPNGNVDNILILKKTKQLKMRMSRMLSRESIDKKKLNRIVMIHTRNKDLSSSVLGSKLLESKLMQTSIKIEGENNGGASLEKLNVNEVSSSVLSKNMDD